MPTCLVFSLQAGLGWGGCIPPGNGLLLEECLTVLQAERGPGEPIDLEKLITALEESERVLKKAPRELWAGHPVRRRAPEKSDQKLRAPYKLERVSCVLSGEASEVFVTESQPAAHCLKISAKERQILQRKVASNEDTDNLGKMVDPECPKTYLENFSSCDFKKGKRM